MGGSRGEIRSPCGLSPFWLSIACCPGGAGTEKSLLRALDLLGLCNFAARTYFMSLQRRHPPVMWKHRFSQEKPPGVSAPGVRFRESRCQHWGVFKSQKFGIFLPASHYTCESSNFEKI